MIAALYLAVREIRRRWRRAVLAAVVVAGAVALSVGLELMGRARERAVEAQIDAAGPALRIIPLGVSSSAANALRFGGAVLPPGTEASARAAAGGAVRSLQALSVVEEPETGWTVLVSDGGGRAVSGVRPGHVVLGAGLAERSRLGVGDSVRLLGRAFLVSGVAAANADARDFAVHAHAADFGSRAPSELQLFLEPGVRAADSERAIRAALSNVDVVRSDRGEIADGGLQGSIASHRAAVQLVIALVALLALLIATHLDVSERRRELALLAAIGGTRGRLAALVVLRSMACAVVGAVAGIAVAVALVVSRPEFALASVPDVAIAGLLLATALSAVAAAPVAISAAVRDPVAELQEG